jgi:hypothetical protein
MMFVVSAVSFCGIFTFLGFQYYWYQGCGLGLAVCIINTVFILFFYGVGLSKLCNVTIFRENANVFTVSLVSIYLVYLSWAGMASYPDAECNPFTTSTANTAAQIAVSLVFTFCTIMSIAFASQTNSEANAPATTSAGAGVIAEKVDEEAK